MSKVKKPENPTAQDNTIELGTLQRDSKNLEEKINIDGEDDDDDDDLYNSGDILDNFNPVVFYFFKRENLPRLFFINLVSWPYPLILHYYSTKYSNDFSSTNAFFLEIQDFWSMFSFWVMWVLGVYV